MTLQSYYSSNALSPYALSGELSALVTSCRDISHQSDVDGLIKTLMLLALDHADWERGLLFLTDGGRSEIQAEAVKRDGIANVLLAPTLRAFPSFPMSVLRYVLRTERGVSVDDAATVNPFSEDDFLRRNSVRSFLCFPLSAQRKIIGVLYLENNSSPRAFEHDRLAILELLIINAAAMLNNIRTNLTTGAGGSGTSEKRE